MLHKRILCDSRYLTTILSYLPCTVFELGQQTVMGYRLKENFKLCSRQLLVCFISLN